MWLIEFFSVYGNIASESLSQYMKYDKKFRREIQYLEIPNKVLDLNL